MLANVIRDVLGNDFASIVRDPNLIFLHSGSPAITNFTTLREMNGTAVGYKVPVGKKLFVSVALIVPLQTARDVIFFGWGTTDIGINSASAPAGETNSKDGGIILSANPLFDFIHVTLGLIRSVPIGAIVPAEQFITIGKSVTQSSDYYFIGKEI